MNIYVACIPKLVTGGIELLHQLTAELNGYEGIEAKIWFMGFENAVIPDAYKQYGNSVFIGIRPPRDSVLIFPEVYVDKANQAIYEGRKIVIYWESVDYYKQWIPKDQYLKFPKDVIHIAQSYYAMDFVERNTGVRPIYVTDYLNDEYMSADLSKPRKRQILYNPTKGFEFTKKIMDKMPNETFIPIQNMTVSEVKNLMEESMLYIDFGNHPGKDRIPREAAMCGCCVITNREGSAAYYEDVSIPNEYRIDMTCENSLDEAIRMIEYCLNHYDDSLLSADFMEYRFRIIDEKVNFKEGVMTLVKKLRVVTG